MAGRPSNRGNRVLFERLESRTLLSAGPRVYPQVGFAGAFDYPTAHVLRGAEPGGQTAYDPALSAQMRDERIAVIGEYSSPRAWFGPELHVGSPDLLRAGATSSGPRETQGFDGTQLGWRGIGQSSGWEHPQLLRSRPIEVEGRSGPDAGYTADAGVGTPQVQRVVTELVVYGSSGSTAVITVVIATAKPLDIVRGHDVDSPPPANASPAPAPLPQLPPAPPSIIPGPQPAQSAPSATPEATTGSTTVVTAAAVPLARIGSGYLATSERASLEAAAVSREAATGATVTSDAESAGNVGTFAIVVPPAAGTIGRIAAAAPVGATTGAIATATAWARSAAAVVERAFAGSLPDAPEAATYLTPAAYNLLRLNPAALFNDPIARIIGESATLAVPGARPSHARAWAITGAVVAADAILVGYWHLDRRRKLRAVRKRQLARQFSVGPAI